MRDLGHDQVPAGQRFEAKNLVEKRDARRMSIPVGRMTQVTPDDEVPVPASAPVEAASPAASSPARKRQRAK